MIHAKYEMPHGGILETYLQDSQISYKKYKKRPAMIICPGGAYLIHATKEGEPVAIEFMQRGFQCFVLRYSVGTDREYPEKGIREDAKYPVQIIQLMEAVHLIYSHAEEWQIEKDQIFISGFSAGGHVAASLAVRWNDSELLKSLYFIPEKKELKPAGVILGYPMLKLNEDSFLEEADIVMRRNTRPLYQTIFHTDNPSNEQKESVNLLNYVSKESSPAFIWNCIDDKVVDYRSAIDYVNKCRKNGVLCEYHMFAQGGHGLSLNSDLTVMDKRELNPSVMQWRNLASSWCGQRIQQIQLDREKNVNDTEAESET